MTSPKALTTLDVSKNQLREIPFQVAPEIENLNLASNLIRFIYNSQGSSYGSDGEKHGTLVDLHKLTKFDVSNNRLESVQEDSLPYTRGRKMVIGLEGNPWRCNCNLKYLKEWLTPPVGGHNIVTSNEANIQCESPPHLGQVTIGSIDSDALQCDVKHKFTVRNVTDDMFFLNYDVSASAEPPYVTMWMMYGALSCQTCELTADASATSLMNEYKSIKITPALKVIKIGNLNAQTRHLVCIYSNQKQVIARQCQVVATKPVMTLPLSTTSSDPQLQKDNIPSWVVVTSSSTISLLILVSVIAVTIYCKIRSKKRSHLTSSSQHHRYHSNNALAAHHHVTPFIMSRTTQNHPLAAAQAATPPLIDADDEFDVTLMTSHHKVIADRSFPSDSCCYSDSHADSIETTATVTSLRHHFDPAQTSYHDSGYHGDNNHLNYNAGGLV